MDSSTFNKIWAAILLEANLLTIKFLDLASCINPTKGNRHAKFFFLLLPFFLVDLGALVHRKKFQSFRLSIFGVTSSLFKLHCLEYFLFRVWLVVMSQCEPTDRFSLTTIQMYVLI